MINNQSSIIDKYEEQIYKMIQEQKQFAHGTELNFKRMQDDINRYKKQNKILSIFLLAQSTLVVLLSFFID